MNTSTETVTDTKILEWIAQWVEEIASPEHDEKCEIVILTFHYAGWKEQIIGRGQTSVDALRNAVAPWVIANR